MKMERDRVKRRPGCYMFAVMLGLLRLSSSMILFQLVIGLGAEIVDAG